MAKRQSTHIRVAPKDKEMWKNFCKSLGKNSPELFNKVINSEKLELNKRVLEELKKNEAELRRKAGF